jgi:hypothetical protein
MINADMRLYNYFTIGEADGYGQPQLPAKDATPKGQIKMAINITSQSVQDNVNYKDCQYVGLTHNKDISDKHLIEYNGKRLKVLYVNPKGRLTQVFLKEL